MSDLDRALDYLLEDEGGWSDNPSDHGGATMFGITQAVYDTYRDTKKKPRQSVKSITRDEASDIYFVNYWQAASCQFLPWPISYVVFDWAVNSGALRAVKLLQQSLSLIQDGQVGPKTLAAVTLQASYNMRGLLVRLGQSHAQFLTQLIRNNQSQLVFLGGWWNRSLSVLSRSLKDV